MTALLAGTLGGLWALGGALGLGGFLGLGGVAVVATTGSGCETAQAETSVQSSSSSTSRRWSREDSLPPRSSARRVAAG